MTTMVENEKSSGQRPDRPKREVEPDLGSAAVRFDKVDAHMREGFARVDQDIRGLRGEMNQLGNSLRGEMNTRFLALEAGTKSLQNTLLGTGGGIIAALIGVVIALVLQ
jgi:hypothetical protein